MVEKPEMGAFEKDTLYRMLVEAARYWVVEHDLRAHCLPESAVFFVYANGSHGIDWGDPPDPDDATLQPLRGKRIVVMLGIEDC